MNGKESKNKQPIKPPHDIIKPPVRPPFIDEPIFDGPINPRPPIKEEPINPIDPPIKDEKPFPIKPEPPNDPPAKPAPNPKPDNPIPAVPSPHPIEPEPEKRRPVDPINPILNKSEQDKNNLQNNKELNMQKSVVSLYSSGTVMMRIPKAQVKFPFESELPAICLFNNEKQAGIATEFVKDEDKYLVSYDKTKMYTYTFFDDGDVPDEMGAELYITADGKLTKTKGNNKKIGIFLGKKYNAILFKLD